MEISAFQTEMPPKRVYHLNRLSIACYCRNLTLTTFSTKTCKERKNRHDCSYELGSTAHIYNLMGRWWRPWMFGTRPYSVWSHSQFGEDILYIISYNKICPIVTHCSRLISTVPIIAWCLLRETLTSLIWHVHVAENRATCSSKAWNTIDTLYDMAKVPIFV